VVGSRGLGPVERVVSAQVCKRRRLLTKTATVWFLQKRPIYRRETTVADELRIGLQKLLRKAMIEQDADFLKEGVRVLSQALMEMEVQEHVGAAPHERSAGRVGQRNGYRERSWDTRVGTVELKVPRVRDSSYFPSLLEPRRKAERALSAVVQEAYVHGVSTRKVDELVKALGMEGISKSRVSTDQEAIQMLAGTEDSAQFIKHYCELRRSGTPLEQALVLVGHEVRLRQLEYRLALR
jgi:hypothetical protein